MDILAGILGYVAGIGALIAGLAISFSVFFATQNPPLPPQSQPQNASAMLVRPSTAATPKGPTTIGALAKPAANRGNLPEKHAAAAAAGAARSPAPVRDLHRKPAGASAQARRLIQEERARRWAYQQDQGSAQGSNHGSSQSRDSSFESRFLGYAD